MSVYAVRWVFVFALTLVLVAMCSVEPSEVTGLGQSLFKSVSTASISLSFLFTSFVIGMSLVYFGRGKRWQVAGCFFCSIVLIGGGVLPSAYYIDLVTSRVSILVAMSCVIFYSLWITDKPEMKIQRMFCLGLVFLSSVMFTSVFRVGGDTDIKLIGFFGNALYLVVTFCSLEVASAIGRFNLICRSGEK